MYKTINYTDVDIKLCDFENGLKIKRSLRLKKKKKEVPSNHIYLEPGDQELSNSTFFHDQIKKVPSN